MDEDLFDADMVEIVLIDHNTGWWHLEKIKWRTICRKCLKRIAT